MTERVNPDEQTDEALVAAALEGRHESFGLLVERYASMVKGIVVRMGLGNQAQDVVQETFLQSFQGLPGLKDPGKFKSWLYGVALRTSKHWHRQTQKHATDHLDEDAHHAERGARPAALTSVEVQGAMERALGMLPERQAHAFALYVQGHSYQEIAEQMSLSARAVDGLIQRAVKSLRERLGEAG